MNNGKVVIEKYCIEPNTQMTILQDEDFRNITVKNDKMFVSRRPLECYGSLFWVTIYTKDSIIVKVELSNADKKYKMNYETINSDLVEELKRNNDKFLQGICGKPDVKTLAGIQYDYSWGKICSYYDNKSSESGIVISYL